MMCRPLAFALLALAVPQLVLGASSPGQDFDAQLDTEGAPFSFSLQQTTRLGDSAVSVNIRGESDGDIEAGDMALDLQTKASGPGRKGSTRVRIVRAGGEVFLFVRQTELHIDGHPEVVADPDRLRRWFRLDEDPFPRLTDILFLRDLEHHRDLLLPAREPSDGGRTARYELSPTDSFERVVRLALDDPQAEVRFAIDLGGPSAERAPPSWSFQSSVEQADGSSRLAGAVSPLAAARRVLPPRRASLDPGYPVTWMPFADLTTVFDLYHKAGDVIQTQRSHHTRAILDAVEQYALDHNGRLPVQLGRQAQAICQTGVACDGVDLDELTRDAAYLTRMPVDPTVGEGEAETGYAIWMDEIGIINVTAALAEPLPGGRKQ